MRELPKQHQQPRPSTALVFQTRKNADSPEMQGTKFNVLVIVFWGDSNVLGSLAGVPSQSYRLGGFVGFLWKRAKAKAKQ